MKPGINEGLGSPKNGFGEGKLEGVIIVGSLVPRTSIDGDPVCDGGTIWLTGAPVGRGVVTVDGWTVVRGKEVGYCSGRLEDNGDGISDGGASIIGKSVGARLRGTIEGKYTGLGTIVGAGNLGGKVGGTSGGGPAGSNTARVTITATIAARTAAAAREDDDPEDEGPLPPAAAAFDAPVEM